MAAPINEMPLPPHPGKSVVRLPKEGRIESNKNYALFAATEEVEEMDTQDVAMPAGKVARRFGDMKR